MSNKGLKLAIVTNAELHHRYFATEMHDHFDVGLIIIPEGTGDGGILEKIRSKRLFMYGVTWFIMKMMSLLYNGLSRHSMSREIRRNEAVFFREAEKRFAAIPTSKIARVETVNSPVVIDLVRKNNIDVICFLGGDIAGGDFINAARICSLNYHSGLSPYYNGNKTIFHAVKDNRPNFAGGTLMYITERIDGGRILSHYLPEIREGDTAASLFMKGIKGAAEVYRRFLEYLADHDLPAGVVQQRSFRYVRNIDWILTDDIKLRKFQKNGGMKPYRRKEQIIDYFDIGSNDIAEVYRRSLGIILGKP